MTPMAIVVLPLVLTVIALVAAGRAFARMADEADQLRAALVRVATLGPVVREIGTDAGRLGAGISRLGR